MLISDTELAALLRQVKTIAVVGAKSPASPRTPWAAISWPRATR